MTPLSAPWSDTARKSVAASVENTTWRSRVLEPDREPLTLPKAIATAVLLVIAAGVFLFWWAGMPA